MLKYHSRCGKDLVDMLDREHNILQFATSTSPKETGTEKEILYQPGALRKVRIMHFTA